LKGSLPPLSFAKTVFARFSWTPPLPRPRFLGSQSSHRGQVVVLAVEPTWEASLLASPAARSKTAKDPRRSNLNFFLLCGSASLREIVFLTGAHHFPIEAVYSLLHNGPLELSEFYKAFERILKKKFTAFRNIP